MIISLSLFLLDILFFLLLQQRFFFFILIRAIFIFFNTSQASVVSKTSVYFFLFLEDVLFHDLFGISLLWGLPLLFCASQIKTLLRVYHCTILESLLVIALMSNYIISSKCLGLYGNMGLFFFLATINGFLLGAMFFIISWNKSRKRFGMKSRVF